MAITTKIPLRVLVIEDSEDDTLLLVRFMERAGYDVTYQRVETPELTRTALARPWDIIIADYRMPHFSGPSALKLLQDTGIDIPFILVSGMVPETDAIEMMKAGAQDFVFKEDLARLIPAIARELHQAEIRRERKTAEENLRSVFTYMPAAFYSFDRNGVILQANSACEKLFGIPLEQLVGKPVFHTTRKDNNRVPCKPWSQARLLCLSYYPER